jgi:hypothetical protein
MAIDEAAAARILVSCARHCSICRRFEPLHLQVHHIKPRSDGGGDEDDNLLAICLTCHCDVHTGTFFTRRFTEMELKGHRDAVCALVAQGKLPSANVPGAVAAAAASAASTPIRVAETVTLTPTQVEILATSGTATGHEQGLIEITLSKIQMGARTLTFPDQRTGARYREAFQGLLSHGVLDRTEHNTIVYLNAEAFRWVDQLLAVGASRSGSAAKLIGPIQVLDQ